MSRVLHDAPPEVASHETYTAFMWLFASVPAHMHDQHILGFEWFLFPAACLPVTGEVFAILFDVIIVDMFDKLILCFALNLAFVPVAYKIPFFLLCLIVISFIIRPFLLCNIK